MAQAAPLEKPAATHGPDTGPRPLRPPGENLAGDEEQFHRKRLRLYQGRYSWARRSDTDVSAPEALCRPTSRTGGTAPASMADSRVGANPRTDSPSASTRARDPLRARRLVDGQLALAAARTAPEPYCSVHDHEPAAVLSAFLRWADMRVLARGLVA